MGWQPEPPTPPDYTALANQQGAANEATARLQAQLNRPNEYTPYGSREWTTNPNNPDQYNVTSTLSPEEQRKLELQNDLSMQMMGIANTRGVDLVNQSLNSNFTPPREAQLSWQNDYAPDQRLQTESGMWEAPYIQEQLDLSGVQGVPTADQDTRKRAEEALYSMGSRYLDPQFARDQSQLDTKLSNQGIFAGSEAHADSQGEFDKAKAQAYGDLRDRSIVGGGEEMQRSFGMGMAAHQTGVQDEIQKGSFANASRSQLISELTQDMQARNAAIIGQGNIATGQQGAANSGSQAWLAQKAQAGTLPLNMMNALQSGTQVNNPQWQPYANNITWEPAPIYQAGKDQFGAAASNYNAEQAGMGNWLKMGATIGAAAL